MRLLIIPLLFVFQGYCQEQNYSEANLFKGYSIVDFGGFGKNHSGTIKTHAALFEKLKSDSTIIFLDENYYYLMSALRSDSLIFSEKFGARRIKMQNCSNHYYAFLNSVLQCYKNGEILGVYGRTSGNTFIAYLRGEIPLLFNSKEIEYLELRFKGGEQKKEVEKSILNKARSFDQFYGNNERDFIINDLKNLFSSKQKRITTPDIDSIVKNNSLIVSFQDNDKLRSSTNDKFRNSTVYFFSYKTELRNGYNNKKIKKCIRKKYRYLKEIKSEDLVKFNSNLFNKVIFSQNKPYKQKLYLEEGSYLIYVE
ncbi:MAG: hypothetical protein HWE22_09780 [Flavobacteriales bacterium]|nr:hypothetical protein [Flavobacteriales bacterium]